MEASSSVDFLDVIRCFFPTCLLNLYPLLTYQHMLCIVAIAICATYTMLATTKYQNILHPVAIVDCTHVVPATISFKDMVTLHRRTLPQVFGCG